MTDLLAWLMAALLGATLAPLGPPGFVVEEEWQSAGPDVDEESGAYFGSQGKVSSRFYRTTPADCGFVLEAGGRDRAWTCLTQQRDAGLAGQVTVFDEGMMRYYRVTAEGDLEVYTDASDGSDLTVVRCRAPEELSRGCA